VKVIAQPAFQNRKGGFAVVQNYGGTTRMPSANISVMAGFVREKPGHDEASALIPENS
jgi:hypothetical protein